MSKEIPVGEWHDYVTTARHANFKAGTKCKVSRDAEGRLILKIGRRIVTLTHNHYALGIESPLRGGSAEFRLAY